MTDLPKRYLEPSELSIEQLIEREQALNRGDELRFESPEYVEARRRLLADHGYEDADVDAHLGGRSSR